MSIREPLEALDQLGLHLVTCRDSSGSPEALCNNLRVKLG